MSRTVKDVPGRAQDPVEYVTRRNGPGWCLIPRYEEPHFRVTVRMLRYSLAVMVSAGREGRRPRPIRLTRRFRADGWVWGEVGCGRRPWVRLDRGAFRARGRVQLRRVFWDPEFEVDRRWPKIGRVFET